MNLLGVLVLISTLMLRLEVSRGIGASGNTVHLGKRSSEVSKHESFTSKGPSL